MRWQRARRGRAGGSAAPSRRVALDRIQNLLQAGGFEQAEAEARALAASSRTRGDGPDLISWPARSLAAGAAVAHGRGAELLPELDTLIKELRQTTGADRQLLLAVRSNRAAVLVQQDRHTEAEAEALDILRGTTRIAHLTEVWRIELNAVTNLAAALNGQGRYEEAEAIARGNLPRADGPAAAFLHCALVRSLNGQKRYEEALAEARRYTPAGGRTASGTLGIVTARALHGLGRRDEAEAAAREALTACEQSLHPAHPRVKEARTLLAHITAEGPTPE
ncbi:tetratricopeptide repeat protein [Streptomyces sp. NP-1717]|uniref:tetratricopeptide repeat protein n=1 Tax=Streptomyces sp. NP-1717 TaxID=2704470 RepID=UPI001F5CBE09|nr:tetratricopeptide repeat protein [Streptomyces sp. NP-1717]MCI3221814.1 tetratricopeptide repeat protein [Streptomyces sp. NP-1717]